MQQPPSGEYSQYQPQGQPQYHQQPPQQYQPPMPQQQPPVAPPVKKRHFWRWIILSAIIGIFIGYAAHSGGGSSTAPDTTTSSAVATTAPQSAATTAPTAKPAPTQAPKPKTWTTTQTFTGNGGKKTASFTVAGNDWKILWSCQETNGLDSPLFIIVYDGNNNMVDSPQTTCKASTTTTGETEEHQGGTFYLDVNTAVTWTLKVQELK
ncbi:MAG TPA: hypothetical protein VGN34_00565 [Ktedonobacteraceae bacterium]